MFYILDKATTDQGINSLIVVLNTILHFIHILAPIILIVMISIDIFKAVINDDDDIKPIDKDSFDNFNNKFKIIDK